MESVCVETRIALLDEKHLIDKTVKFSLALFWNVELALRRLVSPWAVGKFLPIAKFFGKFNIKSISSCFL